MGSLYSCLLLYMFENFSKKIQRKIQIVKTQLKQKKINFAKGAKVFESFLKKRHYIHINILPEIKVDIVRGVCNFLSYISSQQKFEVTDVKALSMSQHSDRPCLSSLGQTVSALGQISVTSLGQISVTAPCYNSIYFRK